MRVGSASPSHVLPKHMLTMVSLPTPGCSVTFSHCCSTRTGRGHAAAQISSNARCGRHRSVVGWSVEMLVRSAPKPPLARLPLALNRTRLVAPRNAAQCRSERSPAGASGWCKSTPRRTNASTTTRAHTRTRTHIGGKSQSAQRGPSSRSLGAETPWVILRLTSMSRICISK